MIEKLIIPDQGCITFISFVGFHSHPQLSLWRKEVETGGEEKRKIDLSQKFFLRRFQFLLSETKTEENVLLSTLSCNQHCGPVDLWCMMFISNSFFLCLTISP
jgi:hypothetical protein